MTEEPVYEYVKGQGWVVQCKPPCPTMSRRIGDYMVTLEEREPALGEHYFVQRWTDNYRDRNREIMDALTDVWWSSRFREAETAEDIRGRIPKLIGKLEEHYRGVAVVVKVEHV
jgi:broad specificity phosphatase PhoE